MKKDPKYGEKIAELKAHFRVGGTIRTLDQIRAMFGYSTRAGAKGFLQKLVSDGLLEFENRSYSPTALMTGFPLFESVRAGLPFTPQEEPSGAVEIDRYLIDHPNSTFLVRVKGDSMKDAGILQGDIVAVDRSREAKNGDIVIASLEGDVTIKYLDLTGASPRLLPANETYPPIVLAADSQILGVVVGSVRKYA